MDGIDRKPQLQEAKKKIHEPAQLSPDEWEQVDAALSSETPRGRALRQLLFAGIQKLKQGHNTPLGAAELFESADRHLAFVSNEAESRVNPYLKQKGLSLRLAVIERNTRNRHLRTLALVRWEK